MLFNVVLNYNDLAAGAGGKPATASR
jgi:hypothetical protein